MALKKQYIYIIIGVGLSVIAVFMFKMVLDQQRVEARRLAEEKIKKMQANQSAVLVAKKDIPRGTVVDAANFETSIVPNQFVQPQAATSLDRVSGMVTIAAISKGEQITLNKLSYSKQAMGGLAEVTPPGKRAITISVDNVSSLAGMIKAGDYVDVIAVIPQSVPIGGGKTAIQSVVLPMFQKVLVLAVGQETSAVPKPDLRFRKEEKQETSLLVTLALAPQEASLIVFVQEQGRIRLIMRSPTDTKIEPVQPASAEALMQYLYPQQAAQKVQEVQHPPEDYVEIIRGSTKERVLLTR